MIFVDTSVWFAASVPEDHRYADCRKAIATFSADLATTDYIVDELLTLLTARGYRDTAVAIGARLWEGDSAQLVYLSPGDVAEAWRVFRTFTDKQWSFTDSTSYAVIERLGITEALSLDDHFRQFGNVKVLP